MMVWAHQWPSCLRSGRALTLQLHLVHILDHKTSRTLPKPMWVACTDWELKGSQQTPVKHVFQGSSSRSSAWKGKVMWDVTARGVFAPPAGNRGKEERCAECRAMRALRWQLWRNQGRVVCPSQSQGDMPILIQEDAGNFEFPLAQIYLYPLELLLCSMRWCS